MAGFPSISVNLILVSVAFAWVVPVTEEMDGVDDVIPVIYRAGIVRHNEEIHGVLLKGLPEEHLPFENPDIP